MEGRNIKVLRLDFRGIGGAVRDKWEYAVLQHGVSPANYLLCDNVASTRGYSIYDSL